MRIPRRNFLGSSLLGLSAGLLEALATPIWKWNRSLVLEAKTLARTGVTPQVQFVDVAKEAGLTLPNVWGGVQHKRLIVEAKGSGLAFFDYDMDGWLDIYLTNGSRLDAKWPEGGAPTSHLYKNNRDGTFTDVTEKSGIGRSRLANRSVRWRLRQRRLGRSVLLFLGTQYSVPQQRRRHVHRCDEEGRRLRRESALGRGLHVAGLRSRRPSGSFRVQLH